MAFCDNGYVQELLAAMYRDNEESGWIEEIGELSPLSDIDARTKRRLTVAYDTAELS